MENSKNTQILNELKQSFEKKDYDAAIALINSNKTKFDPGVYEYNLGIAYYKKGDLVTARVWLEKAKGKGFYSNKLLSAIKEVSQELEVNRLEEAQGFNDSFSQFIASVPIDAYITLSLFFLVLLGIFFKKIDKYIRIILLVLAFLPVTFYGFYAKDFHSIIVLDDEIVYRGPSTMFEQIQLIPKGMKILTGQTYNGWRYIVSPSSHQGWFHTDKVEKL